MYTFHDVYKYVRTGSGSIVILLFFVVFLAFPKTGFDNAMKSKKKYKATCSDKFIWQCLIQSLLGPLL